MADPMLDDEPPAAPQIQFAQYHQPVLDPGDYEITLTQEVTTAGQHQAPFRATRQFSVRGPRYVLDPAAIHGVFPPEGSLGEHSRVLPHIVLHRSTLPWERHADAGEAHELPWLALLLFDDAEAPPPAIVTLATLEPAGAAPYWPGLDRERGDDPATKVSVIDVTKALLQVLLPSKADLPYLAHARRGLDAAGAPVGEEWAVIIGKRLPAPGARSIVHLVSLEGRYGNDGFNFQSANDEDHIRLISLKSWSFACVDEKQSFAQLLWNLDPYEDGQATGRPATLQLPPSGQAAADSYLALGYVPLPHTFRQGSKTVSWYHGPLIPWDNRESVDLPVHTADELVRFLPTLGMFDVSYAAAWTLGRLLTLQSRQISTSLYTWKRSQAQQLRRAEQGVLHLPITPQQQDPAENDIEKTVKAWFAALNLLQGVPFNYLVPAERMLPAESIRFFCLDPLWIDCLLDGAFSIGRVTSADHQHDAHGPAQHSEARITGFLLRSDLVSGWPGLLVDGYDAPDAQGARLLRLRRDRLSPNVLLCLFRGQVRSVAIHQQPETLHFGLDQTDGKLFKKLRDANRGYQETEALVIDPLPWRSESQRILDIARLADLIKTRIAAGSFTSAQFALQMVEGVEKVVFNEGSG